MDGNIKAAQFPPAPPAEGRRDGGDRSLIGSAETFVPFVFVSLCPRVKKEREPAASIRHSLPEEVGERTEEERPGGPFTMTTMSNHLTLIDEEVWVEGREPRAIPVKGFRLGRRPPGFLLRWVGRREANGGACCEPR